MVCEVLMSVYKTHTAKHNLIDNNYLNIFKILKRVLINTGASKLIIKRSYVPNNTCNTNKKVSNTYWRKNGGNFLTSHNMPLTFVFPEFCPMKEITYDFAVDETPGSTYDAIIRCDLLHTLGMDVLFSKR